jgi:hypothetical protein
MIISAPKQCRYCKAYKELSEFRPHRTGGVTRYYRCRTCANLACKRWKRANSKHVNATNKAAQKRSNDHTRTEAKNAYVPWKAEDAELLKNTTKTDRELAKILGRSIVAVAIKRARCGTSKRLIGETDDNQSTPQDVSTKT